VIFLLFAIMAGAKAVLRPDVLIDRKQAHIQDLAYYISMAHYFAQSPNGDCYSLEFRENAAAMALGRPASEPVPYLWSPHSLLVLSPFSYLFPDHLRLAHALWVSFAIGIVILATLLSKSVLAELLVSLSLITPNLIGGLSLGQPSLLVSFLVFWLASSAQIGPFAIIGAGMFLGLKVPYLLLGALTLVAQRRIRSLILLFSGPIVGGTILAGISGKNLWISFAKALMGIQSKGSTEPYKIIPSLMSNLTGAFSEAFDTSSLQIVSLIGFFTLQGLSLLCAVYGEGKSRVLLTLIFSTFGILLFSPYLGWYEEVLVIPLLLLSLSSLSRTQLYAISTLTLLILLRPPLLTGHLGALLFLVKLLLFLLFLYGRWGDAMVCLSRIRKIVTAR